MMVILKRIIFLPFFLAVMMLQLNQAMAQSKATIENVDFHIQNDTLWVTYDILHAAKNEQFNIGITITTASGKTIQPVSVSGDAGAGINGGKGKKICWDINKDRVVIAEGIYVDVTATIYEVQPPETSKEKYFHRGPALLLSAVVPGLGITKLNHGKPFWIMAVAFYGAAAGSYFYYNSANNTYDKYLASEDENERNKLYNQAKSQKTISTILMYTAGAVWLGNMIWTAIHPNKTKPGKNGLSLGGGWNEQFGGAELSVKYRF
ncbi:MAG: hypothetical protein V2A54_07915 [Bacteroidota bacterium]